MKKLLIVSLLLFVSNANSAYHNGSQCSKNSGTWYDPMLTGEGITIQQVNADKLVLYRYHAWPIFDFKTGEKISTVGGYASGLLTRKGQDWEGIITAYKGSEGPLLWQDALIGISAEEREAARDILGQTVKYKVSDLHLDSSTGTVRITVLSPYDSIANQDMYFQLERLLTPDCWSNDRRDHMAFKSGSILTDDDFTTDMEILRNAISRMVKNVIHVLRY